MSEHEEAYRSYQAFAAELCRNFDKDWDKYSEQIDAGWPYLKHIGSKAWRSMAESAIDTWDGWPRNWVKACKGIYETWRGSNKYSSIPYHPTEDLRFPIDKLFAGYDILEREGKAAFHSYAEAVHMPANDRDRVVWKHDYITNPRSKMRLAWGMLRLAIKSGHKEAFPLAKTIIRTITKEIITDDHKVALHIRTKDPNQLLLPHNEHMATTIGDIFTRPDKFNIVKQVEKAQADWIKTTPPGYFNIEDPGYKDEDGNRVPY